MVDSVAPRRGTRGLYVPVVYEVRIYGLAPSPDSTGKTSRRVPCQVISDGCTDAH
jgi:hypothetical protein